MSSLWDPSTEQALFSVPGNLGSKATTQKQEVCQRAHRVGEDVSRPGPWPLAPRMVSNGTWSLPVTPGPTGGSLAPCRRLAPHLSLRCDQQTPPGSSPPAQQHPWVALPQRPPCPGRAWANILDEAESHRTRPTGGRAPAPCKSVQRRQPSSDAQSPSVGAPDCGPSGGWGTRIPSGPLVPRQRPEELQVPVLRRPHQCSPPTRREEHLNHVCLELCSLHSSRIGFSWKQ